jgi:hypothetical protein
VNHKGKVFPKCILKRDFKLFNRNGISRSSRGQQMFVRSIHTHTHTHTHTHLWIKFPLYHMNRLLMKNN